MIERAVRRVAVVDDDDALRAAICQVIALEGLIPVPFANAEEALAEIREDFPGILLADLRMPGMDGIGLFAALLALDPGLPVIILTGHGDMVTAVDLMRRGAYDFINKPFTSDLLMPSVLRALEKRALVLENRALKSSLGAEGDFGLIGESQAMEQLRKSVLQLARTDIGVMIVGETGTGKSLVASLLHRRSARASKPFVTLDCSALPTENADSQIFGHVSGAIPGAQHPRTGQVMQAQGGTLFLDHVDCLPSALQPRIARVIEDRTVLPLGSSTTLQLDVRPVSATCIDIREREFSAALHFRLSGYVVRIPPLRERREDIVPLFRYFLREESSKAGREPRPITPDIWHRLRTDDWAGNARELRSYAIAIVSGLDEQLIGRAVESPVLAFGLKEAVDQYEGQLIRDVLLRNKGDVRNSVAELKLPRKTFYDKLARHEIVVADYRAIRD